MKNQVIMLFLKQWKVNRCPMMMPPFSDLIGGSSNEQAPFSTDEWKESDHPRKKNGQFGKGGNSSESVVKSSKRDKIDSSKHKTVNLPKEEYEEVMLELNTNLTKERKKK